MPEQAAGVVDRSRLASALPGRVTVIHGGRGSGKSVLLEQAVRHARQSGRMAWTIESRSVHDAWSADLIAIDDVDLDDVGCAAAVAAVVRAYDDGSVGAVVLATRLADTAQHPLLSGANRIGPDDLRLNETETQEFAERRGLGEAADAVFAVSEGLPWAADLALAILAEAPAATAFELRAAVAAGLRHALEPAAEITTMLRVADHWNAGMVRDSRLDGDADYLLRELEAGGYAERPHPAAGALRVVGPIAAAVRTGIADAERSGLQPVQRRLIEVLVDRGMLRDAVDIALIADDPVLIRAVVMEAAFRLRWDLLRRATLPLRRKPIAWFGGAGDLIAAVGLADRGATRSHLEWTTYAERAQEGIRLDAGTAPERIVDYCVWNIVFRVKGDLKRAVTSAKRSVQEWELYVGRGGEAWVGAMALDSAAMTFALAQDHARALATVRNAVRAAIDLADPDAVLNAERCMSFVCGLTGDVAQASAVLAGMRERDPRSDGVGVQGDLLAEIARAIVAIERGEYVQAAERLKTAYRLGANNEHWWLVVALQALANAHAGQPGVRHLQVLLEHGRRNGKVVTAPRMLLELQAEVAMVEGRTASLRAMGAAARTHGVSTSLRAAMALASGDDASALRDAQRRPDAGEGPKHAALRALVGAIAAARQGARFLAAEQAVIAYMQMASSGVRSPLRALSADDHVILRELAEQNPELAEMLEWMTAHPGYGARNDQRAPVLTRRELDVLGALARTGTAHEAAAMLGVTHNTVKTMTRRLYVRLGVVSKIEALDVAARWGILAGDGRISE